MKKWILDYIAALMVHAINSIGKDMMMITMMFNYVIVCVPFSHEKDDQHSHSHG